jgi:biopolymer transport protein ExbD
VVVSADNDAPQGLVVQAMLRARAAGAAHFLIAVKHQ